MIAQLPMYDHPALRADTDALWAMISAAMTAEGISAPAQLSRHNDLHAQWRDPDLVLGQTCSFPLKLGLSDHVHVIGSFDYGLPETPPGHYHSVFVTRAADGCDPDALDGVRFVINSADSQSGWGTASGLPVQPVMESGSHRASVIAVGAGHADLAAIDAVTWRILEAHEPDLTRPLRTLWRSSPTLAPPLITAQPDLAAPLRRILGKVAPDAPKALGIKGFVASTTKTYLAEPTPPNAQVAR